MMHCVESFLESCRSCLRQFWTQLLNDGPTAQPASSDPRKIDFVREQAVAHKERWLRYEVGHLRIKHGLTEDQASSLLGEQSVDLASPVLVLSHDDWLWRGTELNDVVHVVAAEIGVDLAGREGKPRNMLSDACRDWAQEEAKRRVATLLAD